MVDTGAIKSYIIINMLRGFSRDVWHAICRKYKWRHTAACWDNTMDQLVPSALLDVRFSAEGEGQDVLNGVFSLNFNKVCMVMDDSRLYSVAHWRCNVTYGTPVSKRYTPHRSCHYWTVSVLLYYYCIVIVSQLLR